MARIDGEFVVLAFSTEYKKKQGTLHLTQTRLLWTPNPTLNVSASGESVMPILKISLRSIKGVDRDIHMQYMVHDMSHVMYAACYVACDIPCIICHISFNIYHISYILY